jgi:glycosyltransferase involved in cell wall biosynthesis
VGKNKKKVGLDVTSLLHGAQVTGIERVIVETHKHLTNLLDPEAFELVPISTIAQLSKKASMHPYLATDPILAKPLADFRECDILFFTNINIGLPLKELIALKKEKNLKIVSLIHDILPLKHPDWFATPEKPTGESITLSGKNFYQIYIQATFAISNQVILISEHVRNEIKSLGWKSLPDFQIIPLGSFDTEPLSKKREKTGLHTVYVSTVTIRKGHAQLIEAFEILWNKGSEITLTLVGGEGWLVSDLIEKIKNHPENGKKLFWKQRLLDSDVEQIYADSDIAFAASYDEGFGLAAEEALSKGLKVISRDIPVFRERSYPNLYFFDADAEALSKKIIEISQVPTLPVQLGSIRTMQAFAKEVAEIISLL